MVTQDEQVKTMQVMVKALAEIDPSGLARKDLGEFSFVTLEPMFEVIRSVFANAANVNWGALPPETLTELGDATNKLGAQTKLLREFSAMKGESPQSERDGIIRNVQTTWNRCYGLLVPHLAYQMATASGNAELTRRLTQVEDAFHGADGARQNAEKVAKEITDSADDRTPTSDDEFSVCHINKSRPKFRCHSPNRHS
jgi:hypothetical protein